MTVPTLMACLPLVPGPALVLGLCMSKVGSSNPSGLGLGGGGWAGSVIALEPGHNRALRDLKSSESVIYRRSILVHRRGFYLNTHQINQNFVLTHSINKA